MINVEWLCAVPAKNLRALESSNMASVRIRTAVGIRAAQALGYHNVISDGQTYGDTKKVIVGKIDYVTDQARPSRWLERLRTLKDQNSHVIIDYTDHHLFAETPASNFYREALPLADTILTSSRKLCAHISESTGREAVMIEDPVEVAIQPPRVGMGKLRTLFWFGHASNLPYLIEYLRDRYRSRIECRLIIMTNLLPLPENYISALNRPHLDKLEINVVRWSLPDMQAAANLSDVCIIPAGVNDPRKNGASANRLLTALAMGLPVAADDLDSYRPFSGYFSDLQKVEIEALLDQPEAAFPSVLSAQDLIRREYTIESAKQHWKKLLSQ